MVNSGKIVVNSGKFPGRKFFDEKNVPDFFFECRKIKWWESSETRFPKFSSQSEPSSEGKQPIKVWIFFVFFQFWFFGYFVAPKRRTELKLWQQTDLELPDVSKFFLRGRRWRKIENLRKTSRKNLKKSRKTTKKTFHKNTQHSFPIQFNWTELEMSKKPNWIGNE